MFMAVCHMPFCIIKPGCEWACPLHSEKQLVVDMVFRLATLRKTVGLVIRIYKARKRLLALEGRVTLNGLGRGRRKGLGGLHCIHPGPGWDLHMCRVPCRFTLVQFQALESRRVRSQDHPTLVPLFSAVVVHSAGRE